MNKNSTKKEDDYKNKTTKWRSLLGGVVCLGLSIIGFWVAFYGEDIQGGIPFIADAANQVIGRIVFGIGALITGLLSVVAFRELLGNRSSDTS